MTKKIFICLIISVSSFLSSNAIEPGYRGFFEYGYLFGVKDYSHSSLNELVTVHGWQMNPRVFIGAGVNLNLYRFKALDNKLHCNLPVFADLRYDLIESKFTPFLDFKIGYSVAGKFTGAYFNPSLGCHFSLTENFGFNLGLGYTYMHTQWKYIDDGNNFNITGIDIRLGIDF